jgi:hypothetical protein
MFSNKTGAEVSRALLIPQIRDKDENSFEGPNTSVYL